MNSTMKKKIKRCSSFWRLWACSATPEGGSLVARLHLNATSGPTDAKQDTVLVLNIPLTEYSLRAIVTG